MVVPLTRLKEEKEEKVAVAVCGKCPYINRNIVDKIVKRAESF
jgi:spore coat polysaccharide biosynthesis protein SpsF (cytidylyltransferase family)